MGAERVCARSGEVRSADRERGARYKPRGRGLGPSNTKKYFTETNHKRVCPMRVERTTYSLGGCRSIQLSYEHATPCQINYFNFKCKKIKKFVALPEATPSRFAISSLRSGSVRSKNMLRAAQPIS